MLPLAPFETESASPGAFCIWINGRGFMLNIKRNVVVIMSPVLYALFHGGGHFHNINVHIFITKLTRFCSMSYKIRDWGGIRHRCSLQVSLNLLVINRVTSNPWCGSPINMTHLSSNSRAEFWLML